MVLTPSNMLPLGTEAPGFELPNHNPNVDAKTVTLDDVSGGKALVVVFMCNHCPYVVHIADQLATVAEEYQEKGIEFVGISSNDVANYPDDSPENMAKEAERRGYTFPYLYDEDQSVAQAYKAACTPDLFVFDGDRKLVYRGQFDASRPGNDVPVTGADLKEALDAILAGNKVPEDQTPSVGCNIKWRSGNEPN